MYLVKCFSFEVPLASAYFTIDTILSDRWQLLNVGDTKFSILICACRPQSSLRHKPAIFFCVHCLEIMFEMVKCNKSCSAIAFHQRV